MCEVDVFEHPRFCNEFSHLVNSRFLDTETLRGSLTSMEWMFEMIETFSLIFTMVIKLSIIFFIILTSV